MEKPQRFLKPLGFYSISCFTTRNITKNTFNMKKTVSLVLSSGGARGIAHIGAIEELEKHGFEIKVVAGSSIGAAIGGIYASGNLKKYKDWVLNLDKYGVFKLLDFTFSSHGFIKGEKLKNKMRNFLGDPNIEDLNIPYIAVAADLYNQKEVVSENTLIECPPGVERGWKAVGKGILRVVAIKSMKTIS